MTSWCIDTCVVRYKSQPVAGHDVAGNRVVYTIHAFLETLFVILLLGGLSLAVTGFLLLKVVVTGRFPIREQRRVTPSSKQC